MVCYSTSTTFCASFFLYTSEGDLCICVKQAIGICSRAACWEKLIFVLPVNVVYYQNIVAYVRTGVRKHRNSLYSIYGLLHLQS